MRCDRQSARRSAPTPLDAARMAEAQSIAVALGEPMTREEARHAADELRDAITALQSLDDLGSPEANQEAWDRMMDLERKLATIKEKWNL